MIQDVVQDFIYDIVQDIGDVISGEEFWTTNDEPLVDSNNSYVLVSE